jgi:N-acetylmuramoyl-L-alanine amidase
MQRQLEMLAESDVVKGSVFFRFGSITGPVGDAIRDFYTGAGAPPPRQPVMTVDTLMVGMPRQDATITAAPSATPGHSIVGASVPDIPLYMNGVEITNRTLEGFFYVFAPLETGENVFTFSQEGQEDVTRIITRNAPGPAATPTPAPTITQITTPTYATVTSDAAWVFPGHTTSGGSGWMLSRGQQDRVVAESSNGFVRLSCGMWINRNNITLRTENRLTENVLRNGVYRAGSNYDVIAWRSDVFPAVHAGFDGQVLTLSFGMHTEAPPLTLPGDLSGTIFSGFSSGLRDGTPYYAFTIRDGVRFEGHYIDHEDGELRLHLKKRKTLAAGSMPLTGITVVLDPGHGGDEYGAVGPLGRDLAEKELNLINSRKLAERLRALGDRPFDPQHGRVRASPAAGRLEQAAQDRPVHFTSCQQRCGNDKRNEHPCMMSTRRRTGIGILTRQISLFAVRNGRRRFFWRPALSLILMILSG